jgi:hypothetical protein
MSTLGLIDLAGGSDTDVYYFPPIGDLHGIPISISLADRTKVNRRATMGGIICVGPKYFGLTIGHVFSSQEKESAVTEEADLDFSLEDYSDEEVDEAEDEEFVVMTSKGK